MRNKRGFMQRVVFWKVKKNKDAKIVVYCKRNQMGQVAAEQLIITGYTRVFNIKEGMLAWQHQGRRLVHRQPLSGEPF
jgi:rhodanese-related sulfurtransferase